MNIVRTGVKKELSYDAFNFITELSNMSLDDVYKVFVFVYLRYVVYSILRESK